MCQFQLFMSICSSNFVHIANIYFYSAFKDFIGFAVAAL